MQQNLNSEETKAVLAGINYLVGDESVLCNMPQLAAKKPFDETVVEFLNSFSRRIMADREAKAFPDVVTLGFWTRKASIKSLKDRFCSEQNDALGIKLGRGVAFHIAPSNVPVNYAYSLITGLLTGNANVVRIPSKDFPQVDIINRVLVETLKEYDEIKPYICLVRYGRDQKINDVLSSIADTRIVWGGDDTIAELRKSPLGPRATEITFADRYSLAVIDSDAYLAAENKAAVADAFYNDTFLTDQNACTSPRLVVWTGSEKDNAQNEFWIELHKLVEKKYTFQSIMGINKLTSSYLAAVALEDAKIVPSEDNLIKRVKVASVDAALMDLRDNSGYFYEYDCDDILKIRDFCNNTHCQTIAYIGEVQNLMPLIESGIKGVDRIVPIGKTMDFDFIWDGYNLIERLTRTVAVV